MKAFTMFITFIAVRRSIGAFPTSVTKNVLAEAGFQSIEDRVQTSTFKLIPKLYNSNNKIFLKDLISATKHKKDYSIKSDIRHCINFVSIHKIDVHTKLGNE